MDGLAIVTGISMIVFLLFYLAFNINDRNKLWTVIKYALIVFGLFILSYIPATTIYLDRDCNILNNGSYLCYKSDGTIVTAYQNGTTQIGSGLSVVYVNFLYIVMAGFFLGIFWFGLLSIVRWWRTRKILK